MTKPVPDVSTRYDKDTLNAFYIFAGSLASLRTLITSTFALVFGELNTKSRLEDKNSVIYKPLFINN